MKHILLTAALTFCAALLAESPSFEVASVKPNNTKDGHSSTNISRDRDAVKLTMTSVNLKVCIQRAYGVKAYQIEGPDWLKSEEFDILGTVPESVPSSEIWPRLQTLLIDRFKLALHRETKVMPMYELVLGKGGAKIQPTEDIPGPHGTWNNVGQMIAKFVSMPDFAEVLSRNLDRPVIDKTGLSGVFNFVLDYTTDDPRSVFHGDSANTQSAPSIYTALQEKLGLKLEAKKGPIEILVIDHIGKTPTEN